METFRIIMAFLMSFILAFVLPGILSYYAFRKGHKIDNDGKWTVANRAVSIGLSCLSFFSLVLSLLFLGLMALSEWSDTSKPAKW